MHGVPDCKVDLCNPISVPEEVYVDICKEKQKDAAVGKGWGRDSTKGKFSPLYQSYYGNSLERLGLPGKGNISQEKGNIPFSWRPLLRLRGRVLFVDNVGFNVSAVYKQRTCSRNIPAQERTRPNCRIFFLRVL